MSDLVWYGWDGKEQRSAHRHSQGEWADGERSLREGITVSFESWKPFFSIETSHLVDDFVLPGVGQKLIIPVIIATPNAEEGVGAEREEPEEQDQYLDWRDSSNISQSRNCAI